MISTNIRCTAQCAYVLANHHRVIVDCSPDFCEEFSFEKTELIGALVDQVIEQKGRNKVGENRRSLIVAMIKGQPCLVQVTSIEHLFLYNVIAKENDFDPLLIYSFMDLMERGRRKKSQEKNKLYDFHDIIGESESMVQVKELAAKIAAGSSTILLTGESGTGKELFAQAIHMLSPRRQHPFVAVNCAAIPDELFESEVFGYEGGAFSGAKREGKPGKIELAQHGTLFLDEISELSYQSQGKLLRVLQERELERLGGTKSKYVDIRIIAATNKDLKRLVKEGKFRQDLFYRLYVFEIMIPPLRRRKEDILPLAYHFIDHFNKAFHKHVRHVSQDLKRWLLSYEWPGNVRELRSFIERGMNMVEGDTLTLDCCQQLSSFEEMGEEQNDDVNRERSPLLSLEEEVARAEKLAIKRALQEAGGDRTKAAQMLDIHVTSLYRKMGKYGLK
ncbi:sigma-54 interaction domain-containing protein [Geobacillus sp. BK01]|uniref:sigma-54 interaction domain-containing protein n=1 Tax=Geobacillus sp. BK01 TaxID=3457328 RepID=UPI003FA575F9